MGATYMTSPRAWCWVPFHTSLTLLRSVPSLLPLYVDDIQDLLLKTLLPLSPASGVLQAGCQWTEMAQPVKYSIYQAWHSAACKAKPSWHRCWLPHLTFSSVVQDIGLHWFKSLPSLLIFTTSAVTLASQLGSWEFLRPLHAYPNTFPNLPKFFHCSPKNCPFSSVVKSIE